MSEIMTPEGPNGFTGLPNWIQRTLSNGFTGEPSTKRHVVAIAALTLCFVTAVIGLAIFGRILFVGDVGSGAVAALTFTGGVTAALAGNAYRKPEKDPEPSAPSLPLVVVQGSGSSVGPATTPVPIIPGDPSGDGGKKEQS